MACTALVHDLTKPLPFKENSVSVIYEARPGASLPGGCAEAPGRVQEGSPARRGDSAGRADLRSMVASYLKNKNGGSPSPSERIAAADKLNEC